MNSIQIILDPTVLNQRQVLNLNIKGKGRRVIFETRYLERVDKWFVSFYDAQSGDAICTNIPLVVSVEEFFNLLEPFMHKNIGWLACIKAVENTSTENPSKNNLGEFILVWGDTLEPDE